MLLAIIWIVLFLLWALSGWWVNTNAGTAYRAHNSLLLVVLIGILGWICFHGFSGIR